MSEDSKAHKAVVVDQTTMQMLVETSHEQRLIEAQFA